MEGAGLAGGPRNGEIATSSLSLRRRGLSRSLRVAAPLPLPQPLPQPCCSRCCRTVALADLDLLPPCCLLRFPFLPDLVPLPPPLRRETLKKQSLSSVFFGRPEPPRRPRPHPPLRRRRPGSRQQKPAPPLGARLRPGHRPRPAGFDSLRRRPRQPRRGPGLPHDRRRPPRRRLAHPGDQVDAVERL